MAVVVKKGHNSEKLKETNVYLFCVESEEECLNLEEVPCLQVNCLCGHIARLGKLDERRCVFLANNNLSQKLQNLSCPLLISIDTSCDIKVSLCILTYFSWP